MLALLLVSSPALAERGRAPDDLARVEIELMHADEQLRGAAARVRQLEEEVGDRVADLEQTEHRLQEHQHRTALRVRAMYRFRHRGFLPMLFAARDPHELLRTARYLWWIVRADEAALADWQQAAIRAATLRDELQARRAELLQRAGEVILEREELREARTLAQRALGRTPSPTRRHMTTVLDAAAPESVDVSLDLSREEAPPELQIEALAPTSLFARNRGHLPMPVQGQVERSGRGIAIAAPTGTSIRAVADGTVDRILPIQGYGLVAIVDHGEEWATVYGHGEAFTVALGTRVRTGQEIGSVGVDPAAGSGRLHFEVRQGHVPQDPLEWLKVPAGLRPRD